MYAGTQGYTHTPTRTQTLFQTHINNTLAHVINYLASCFPYRSTLTNS